MKFFLSFLQSSKKHPIAGYDFWQYYIKNGIEEAGCEWVEHEDIDWALGLVPQSEKDLTAWREKSWEKTLTRLKESPVDVFLSYLYPEQIDISAINEIKRLGIPCVNFYCDNVRQFTSIPKQFKAFNLNWVPEYKALPLYKKAGYAFINLPMPMWIPPHYRVGRREKNDHITFIGSKDVQRLLLFEQIVKQKPDINLHIYGNGWTNSSEQPMQQRAQPSALITMCNQFTFIKQHGVNAYRRKLAQRNINTSPGTALQAKLRGNIDFDNYNRLTTESCITVGVNRYPSFLFPLKQPDTYSRLRDVEAPMLGACYLTEYTAGLEEMYEIGKEITVYKTADDFVALTDQLANDEKLRKTLREKGQKRALTDHSIPRSINAIIKRLK